MRKVKVSAVQMKCTTDVWENIANAEKFVRQAKEDGANIVLLPELFERQYFVRKDDMTTTILLSLPLKTTL